MAAAQSDPPGGDRRLVGVAIREVLEGEGDIPAVEEPVSARY
jgi:hypothetical protein